MHDRVGGGPELHLGKGEPPAYVGLDAPPRHRGRRSPSLSDAVRVAVDAE